jgi:membrane protein YqaA with SNARE-associated domain
MEQSTFSSQRFWVDLSRSRTAALIAFVWGFAEATLFFIVPDVWIGLLSLFDWRGGLRAAGWAVLGALLGGALMYGVGARLASERSARLLDTVPAISPAMIEHVETAMRDEGPRSMLWGPLQGTPYKIYARTAGEQGQPLLEFLLWTVPARGARFVLIAAVSALGASLVQRMTSRVEWLLGPDVVAWTIFYALYFACQGW